MGEGGLQGSMVLLVKYSLIDKYEIFIHSAPCQSLGISCQSTLMQAIQRLGISTRALFMGCGLIYEYHRQLCRIAVECGLRLSMVLLADFYGNVMLLIIYTKADSARIYIPAHCHGPCTMAFSISYIVTVQNSLCTLFS